MRRWDAPNQRMLSGRCLLKRAGHKESGTHDWQGLPRCRSAIACTVPAGLRRPTRSRENTKEDFLKQKYLNLEDCRLSLSGNLLRLARRASWDTDSARERGMGKMTPQGRSFAGEHSYDNNVKCGRVLHFN